MSQMGQTTTTPKAPLCPLPPAADMPPHWLMCEKCQEATLHAWFEVKEATNLAGLWSGLDLE
jgi:hypothetical protein